MPKRNQRKINKENSYLKYRVGFLLRTKEFRIGLLAVAVFIVAFGFFYSSKSGLQRQYDANKTNLVSPIPQESTPEAEVKRMEQMEKLPVKMLADTAGILTVEVREGDNYWNISKRVCGTGKFYLAIQAQNNSKSLHPGVTVEVICEE